MTNDTGRLAGRVAIVTGGASGIGNGIAHGLAAEGACVGIADVAVERAEGAAPPGALVLRVDVSQEGDTDRMVGETLERFGRVDILVNCAGIVARVPWVEMTFADWRRVLSVNLDGAFLATRAASAPMREAGYGRIVNIASNSFLGGTQLPAPYIASKGGIVGLTRALASELGAHGITVNAVAPGLTETEETAVTYRELFAEVVDQQCIPRRGTVADVVPPVVFLSSEASRWVTGQLLVVDGGAMYH